MKHTREQVGLWTCHLKKSEKSEENNWNDKTLDFLESTLWQYSIYIIMRKRTQDKNVEKHNIAADPERGKFTY